MVQINEQPFILKNNGKIEKYNQCKTRKQQKRLFKIDIKTKLYLTLNI